MATARWRPAPVSAWRCTRPTHRARGIAEGDAVKICNDRGALHLTALMNSSLPAGVVAGKLDWAKLSPGGANVNALTSERLTDLGGGATFYSTLVEVAKM